MLFLSGIAILIATVVVWLLATWGADDTPQLSAAVAAIAVMAGLGFLLLRSVSHFGRMLEELRQAEEAYLHEGEKTVDR